MKFATRNSHTPTALLYDARDVYFYRSDFSRILSPTYFVIFRTGMDFCFSFSPGSKGRKRPIRFFPVPGLNRFKLPQNTFPPQSSGIRGDRTCCTSKLTPKFITADPKTTVKSAPVMKADFAPPPIAKLRPIEPTISLPMMMTMMNLTLQGPPNCNWNFFNRSLRSYLLEFFFLFHISLLLAPSALYRPINPTRS